MKIFGREPAQIAQLLSGVLIFLVPYMHMTDTTSGAVIAVITAAGGLATAATVSAEKAAPLVAGLLKALFALALALHFALPVELQSGVMVIVEGLVAFYLRTQVVAPVAVAIPARPVVAEA